MKHRHKDGKTCVHLAPPESTTTLCQISHAPNVLYTNALAPLFQGQTLVCNKCMRTYAMLPVETRQRWGESVK